MKTAIINQKEKDYGNALAIAIDAVRKAMIASIEAEYDISDGEYSNSDTSNLAEMLNTLRKLHTGVNTYNPNPKKEED